MKSILILAPGFQKKWDVKLMIVILLIFLVVSCKKEGEPQKPVYAHYPRFRNLSWIESAPDSGFQLQVPSLQGPHYSLGTLLGVYLVTGEGHCPFLLNPKYCRDFGDIDSALEKLPKDGDISGKIFYAIRNGEVVLYVKRTSDSFFLKNKETVQLNFK